MGNFVKFLLVNLSTRSVQTLKQIILIIEGITLFNIIGEEHKFFRQLSYTFKSPRKEIYTIYIYIEQGKQTYIEMLRMSESEFKKKGGKG